MLKVKFSYCERNIFHVDQTCFSIKSVLFICYTFCTQLQNRDKTAPHPFPNLLLSTSSVFHNTYFRIHLKCFWSEALRHNLTVDKLNFQLWTGLIIAALIAFQVRQFYDILLLSHLTKAKCSAMSDRMYCCAVKAALSRCHGAFTVTNWFGRIQQGSMKGSCHSFYLVHLLLIVSHTHTHTQSGLSTFTFSTLRI